MNKIFSGLKLFVLSLLGGIQPKHSETLPKGIMSKFIQPMSTASQIINNTIQLFSLGTLRRCTNSRNLWPSVRGRGELGVLLFCFFFLFRALSKTHRDRLSTTACMLTSTKEFEPDIKQHSSSIHVLVSFILSFFLIQALVS